MYLDAAVERVEGDHDARIEVVRAGTIFARDNKAHAKWRNAHRRKTPALDGNALETAVMNIARLFPENVIRGTL